MNAHDIEPVVNGCYLDVGGEMYKVRMLDYQSGEIFRVVCEDTLGRIHRMAIEQWRNTRLIPMCLSWHYEPSYVCFEQDEASRHAAQN